MHDFYFDDAQLALLTHALQNTEGEQDAMEMSQTLLHQLIERQVERAPEAIAVSYEGQHRSYREINTAANHLAFQLQEQGAGPGTLIGVCLERSVGLIIALLAVLKTGAAYVPVDPSTPMERMAYILQDAQVLLTLTESHLQEQLSQERVVVLVLESGWEQKGMHEFCPNPTSTADSESLAYLIYTSGSTGRPKGVEITHKNLLHLFTQTYVYFDFHEQDVWTMFHSSAFDFSVWEIWGPLVNGARLVVVPYLTSRSPEAFLALLACERVTVLNQTPSAFRHLIAEQERNPAVRLSALRYVIFGGEALDFASLRPWVARYGDEQPQLINMYGLTEATVHTTYQQVRRSAVENETRSLIGTGLPGVTLYALDEQQQQVPPGSEGELYVSGENLTRGYWRRPELTNERFLPDPFRPQPEARMYRTGDIVRSPANGERGFVYLGRKDFQVKIRGFRIELGEIEALLTHHAQVRECAVIAQDDKTGNVRLVAYIVLARGQVLDSADLRRFLSAKLPEYMVPTVFLALEAFPLTINGKLDRKRLASPDHAAMLHAEEHQSSPVQSTEQLMLRSTFLQTPCVEPRDEVEQAIAAIWVHLLEIDQVGIHDDFFQLGGHSLLAIQVVTRIRQRYPVEFTLREFLSSAPTIANISETIQHMLAVKLETLTEEQALQLLQTLKDA